jgi:glycosyltransferase involved in cell wall biosynthesis
MHHKNMLIISHDFPPTWHGGVIRLYSLVKHLLNSNLYGVVVISAHDKYSFNVFQSIQIENQIKSKLILIKTKSLEPCSNNFQKKVFGAQSKSFRDKFIFFILKTFVEPLLIPDRSVLWLPYALFHGIKTLRNREINLIFSTGPPFTNLLVAKILSILHDKFLVVDFRDDWAGNPFYNKGFLRRVVNNILERWVISGNTKIITTSSESKDEFIKKYAPSIKNNITVITNGYDEELPNKIKMAGNKVRNFRKDKIVFLYAGSLTALRTPEFFLKAIRLLTDKSVIAQNEIAIKFVGYSPIAHKILCNEFALNSIVEFIEPVSQEQLVDYYVTSDILLLFQRASEGGRTAIPGKVYEYFCSRKPILLMSDGGATDNLITKLKAGYVAQYESINDIANIVYSLITEIIKQKPLNIISMDHLESFNRNSINNNILKLITSNS